MIVGWKDDGSWRVMVGEVTEGGGAEKEEIVVVWRVDGRDGESFVVCVDLS